MEKIILPDMSGIPPLYGTENIATDDKIVHQVWRLPIIPGIPIYVLGFYWLICEYSAEEQLAWGFACLNDKMNSEFGYISITELLQNHVMPDPFHSSRNFSEVMKSLEAEGIN
jgi:hypothetical protein